VPKDFRATALERAIGRQLAGWRNERELSLTEADRRVGFSSAKLSMMENAVQPSAPVDVMALNLAQVLVVRRPREQGRLGEMQVGPHGHPRHRRRRALPVPTQRSNPRFDVVADIVRQRLQVPPNPALVTAHRRLDDQHSFLHQQIRDPAHADLRPDDPLAQRAEFGHRERLRRCAMHDHHRRQCPRRPVHAPRPALVHGLDPQILIQPRSDLTQPGQGVQAYPCPVPSKHPGRQHQL